MRTYSFAEAAQELEIDVKELKRRIRDRKIGLMLDEGIGPSLDEAALTAVGRRESRSRTSGISMRSWTAYK
jgi:hypothetical protein